MSPRIQRTRYQRTQSCPYFTRGTCRSCSLLARSPQHRLPVLADELQRLAGEVLPWVECQTPFPSRAKAKLSVSMKAGELTIGLLDEQLEGIELLQCPLHLPIINQTLEQLPALIARHQIPAYHIKKRRGELKGLIAQTNKAQDHLQLRAVLRSTQSMAQIKTLAQDLAKRIPQKLSVSANIQAIPHQILEGPEEHQLLGQAHLWEEFNSIHLAYPTRSFMQVTPEIAEQLYAQLQSLLHEHKAVRVIDLFCGAGGFALHSARQAEKVLGIERSQAACQAASEAASINGFDNVEFLCRNLDDTAQELEQELVDFGADTIICNPPRRGLGQRTIALLETLAPQQVVYSSCNPKTFISDAEQLAARYELLSLQPFEMFPLTAHYEVLGIFKRR